MKKIYSTIQENIQKFKKLFFKRKSRMKKIAFSILFFIYKQLKVDENIIEK